MEGPDVYFRFPRRKIAVDLLVILSRFAHDTADLSLLRESQLSLARFAQSAH
jgi:hypothetical protein